MSKQSEAKAAPIIKYRTGFGTATKIERVEVLRETAASVFLASSSFGGGERRASKSSPYETYHDSWADAHTYLTMRAGRAVEHARCALEVAKGHLGNIKGMKPPKELA